ncbi:MAG TPA: ribose-5-phosphate isomerase RpiA [Ktedonobacteraceae bacterium]|jgi:ribose 5-phosphate isomerase A|nr:ribose-5-phosphate isomerase RpiA [Ktedonobacteraceae bacterium]
MAHDIRQDSWKQLAGKEAARLVQDNMLVGLGTGSTANCFIFALAERIQQGLRVAGTVSSSRASQELAASLGIPVTTLDTHPELDLYVDGADEIDPQLQLLKGAGGALLREKIVATSSQRFIVIADVTKQVDRLGSKFPVPVETAPFALEPVRRRLQALGTTPRLRQVDGKTFVTENGNVILDCAFADGIANPEELDARLHAIVGVVETGLFLNIAAQVIIGGPEGIITLP